MTQHSFLPSFIEYVYCSNRGICNFETGDCKCFKDFLGSKCDTYNYGLRGIETIVGDGILTLQNTLPSFTGTVLTLSSTYGSTGTFKFLKITDDTRDGDTEKAVFTIDGYGNVEVNYGSLLIPALVSYTFTPQLC